MAAGMTSARCDYALVHLVSQEADKDLIGPQVLDNAAAQLCDGPHAPAVVAAAFLEPVRHAFSRRIQRRMREHAARRPGVRVLLLPYVSRLSRSRNAGLLARRLRSVVGRRAVVLHCRGESAVDWAIELASLLNPSAIIADIRGAWPEELLFARGFYAHNDADEQSRAAHDSALAHLQQACAASAAVVSVSAGMIEWLSDAGVPVEKLTYVPCCVTGQTFDPDVRESLRRSLGLSERLVLCYLGTITRYQHVHDGVLPFFRAAAAEAADAHLLCVTPEKVRMANLVAESGIAMDRVTIVSAAQSEVAAYLSAADAGILLRAPSRLNRYSQPTKLGEYLAAGLPVIVSRGTGRVDELIENERAGAAVTVFGLSDRALREEARRVCDELRACAASFRVNALALCHREFEWGRYTTILRDMYVDALRQRIEPVRNTGAN